MSLTAEWTRRINSWRNELPKFFYTPLGTLEMEAFFTFEHIKYEEAIKRPFKPIKQNSLWGKEWEYGWFRCNVVLPNICQGKRVELRLDTGGDCLVWINGTTSGTCDWAHKEITLSTKAVASKRYSIVVEASAGNGPHRVHPIPLGRLAKEYDVKPPFAKVGVSTYGIWEEEIYQLWLDVETLWQLRNCLDSNSLRQAQIDEALRQFATIVDIDSPTELLIEQARKARQSLKKVLLCKNGPSTPTLYCVGHSHIDLAWLWPLSETRRKCGRTFSQQLALMEQYPEYKFLQSQPQLYQFVKEDYPELYNRIKKAIKQGKFISEGGMWVEADTNISSGESLIRQFVYGLRFFKQEFNVDCKFLWLPDVFGYSGSLPQIMKGCGIKYFATSKILWNYNASEPFPFNTFLWEGIDGSRIPTHLLAVYYSTTEIKDLIQRWNEVIKKDGVSTRFVPFGYGDGGGGPTRNHLEFVRRAADLEGVPKVCYCHPLEFFDDLEQKGFPDDVYTGELYFTGHRGTYTTQAKIKKGNRKSEILLHEIELWSALAMLKHNVKPPIKELDSLWKKLLLNQFHDILPGSSIREVVTEAEKLFDELLEKANIILKNIINKLITNATNNAITVFNSLCWDRTSLVKLPPHFEGAKTGNGHELICQKIGSELYTLVELPSCGWTTLYNSQSSQGKFSGIRVTNRIMENEFLRLKLNDKGELISIFDKETSHELTAGPCNSFRMYRDYPGEWDAWDIDSIYKLTPIELSEKAEIIPYVEGPLVGIIKIRRVINNSDLTQEIIIYKGSRRIDFRTVIDWNENHKLLKVNFPLDIHSNEGVHEIQFGHIKRPNHRSRPYDIDRFEVCNQRWSALMEQNRGCAILNDCKYGVNIDRNSINLTLLRSAVAPDPKADKGLHQFVYAFYSWNGNFLECDLIRQGYELNYDLQSFVGESDSASFFTVDNPAVILETIKPADDNSGNIVLRLYESKSTTSNCIISTPFSIKQAWICDMLERPIQNLPIKNGAFELFFRPFKIITVRLDIKVV